MIRKAIIVMLAIAGSAGAIFLATRYARAEVGAGAPELQTRVWQQFSPGVIAMGTVGISASLKTADSAGTAARVVSYAIWIECAGSDVVHLCGFQQVAGDSVAPIDVTGVFTIPRPEDVGFDECTPLRASATINLAGGKTWGDVTDPADMDVQVTWQGR